MRSKLLLFIPLVACVFFILPGISSAHEAYVLNHQFFWSHLDQPISWQVLDALKNPANLQLTLKVVGGVIALFIVNFFFRHSRPGIQVHAWLERWAFLGPLFIRVAIAAALFVSALSWSFLGPELPLTQMPFAIVLRVLLFIISICIALGLFTEIAAGVAFIIFCIGFFVFGTYLITYLNYLGEIIVLVLFGMRQWSLDGLFFGKEKFFSALKPYESTIVRVCYGIALMFAALTVKFLHPALTVQVVTQWHLTQFHWLFPSDPLLVTLGAGLAELAIGLFIIIGFEMRLTVLISLFYITLSLMYFHEIVWPHLMLYGISLNILVQPERFTLDYLLFNKHQEEKPLILATSEAVVQ